jgi:hypothetical protein
MGVTRHSNEPTIPNPITLEVRSGEEWLPHEATVANLTRNEVWVGVPRSLGEALDPERTVRLVLRRPDGETQTAETMVLWHIGTDDRLVALARPPFWDPPSRRANSRTQLSIPLQLHAEEAAPPVSARTTNLGVGGALCLAESTLPVGRRLPVSLRLTPHQSFSCQAEVVRVESDQAEPSRGPVLLALRFPDLTQDQKATLASSLAAIADDLDANSVPRAWRSAPAVRG